MTVPGNNFVAHSHRDVKEAVRESGDLDKVFLRRLVETKGEGRVNALNAKQPVTELEKANIGLRHLSSPMRLTET
jgi:hypothetical protein